MQPTNSTHEILGHRSEFAPEDHQSPTCQMLHLCSSGSCLTSKAATSDDCPDVGSSLYLRIKKGNTD